VDKARGVNALRVKKYRRRRIEYRLLRGTAAGRELLYVTIEPCLVPGFSPGLCLLDRWLLAATSYPDLARVLPLLERGETPSPSTGYFLLVRDPGFGVTLGFLKKMFSDPLRKRRMGEARVYRLLKALDAAGEWAARLGGLLVEETARKKGDILFKVTIVPR